MKLHRLQRSYRNSLLASLPANEKERLERALVPMIFKKGQTLHDAGQTVDTIYFFEDGVCSVVVTMQDGSSIEVGLIGRDNFVGLAGVLGTGSSVNRSSPVWPAMIEISAP